MHAEGYGKGVPGKKTKEGGEGKRDPSAENREKEASASASYPDVSLKMYAQRKAGRTLPMVPCGSSPVTCFALASAMRKTKRLRRRLPLHHTISLS